MRAGVAMQAGRGAGKLQGGSDRENGVVGECDEKAFADGRVENVFASRCDTAFVNALGTGGDQTPVGEDDGVWVVNETEDVRLDEGD